MIIESVQKFFALIIACKLLLLNRSNINVKRNPVLKKELDLKIEYQCLCLLKSKHASPFLITHFGEFHNWKEISSWFDEKIPKIELANLVLRFSYLDFDLLRDSVNNQKVFIDWFKNMVSPPKPKKEKKSAPNLSLISKRIELIKSSFPKYYLVRSFLRKSNYAIMRQITNGCGKNPVINKFLIRQLKGEQYRFQIPSFFQWKAQRNSGKLTVFIRQAKDPPLVSIRATIPIRQPKDPTKN